MRVAFVGKGGAGKSSLAGTFARLLAEDGARPVLALDSDPMPGLAFSLGVERSDAGLPDEAVQVDEDGDGRRRYRLADGLDGATAVQRYAVRAPGGVHFLQLGKARGPQWDNTRQHHGFQRVLDDLPGDRWHVVGDLPGGTRQPFMTWGRYARTFLVVVEPTPASLLSGRRLARLAADARAPEVFAIANKVRETGDARRVADRTGLEIVGEVPFDPGVVDADRAGCAVLDTDPGGPTVTALRSLVSALLSREDRL